MIYMVVNKKIEKKEELRDPDEYLSRGGKVRADMIDEQEITQWQTISLRIPQEMLKTVDHRVKERAALTRTAWILEAIQQKLKAEGQNEQRREES